MPTQNWIGYMHMFVAVARTKNYTRAAAALGMPISTLSRRIAELEKAMGLRLLNRTTRRVELTEDGANYFARAEHIVEEVRLAHEAIRNRVETPGGLLRVAMPEEVATHVAAPWLAEFTARYPHMSIEIDTAPTHIDPVADNFDVCILLNAVRDSSFTIRRLATFSSSLFASPAYVAANGLPEFPRDLADHQCICVGPRGTGRAIWTLSRGQEHLAVEVAGRVASVSHDLGLELARHGLGIAAGITRNYTTDVAEKRLVPVLDKWHCDPLMVSAITPAKLIPAKTRVFLDFFAARMNEMRKQIG